MQRTNWIGGNFSKNGFRDKISFQIVIMITKRERLYNESKLESTDRKIDPIIVNDCINFAVTVYKEIGTY